MSTRRSKKSSREQFSSPNLLFDSSDPTEYMEVLELNGDGDDRGDGPLEAFLKRQDLLSEMDEEQC